MTNKTYALYKNVQYEIGHNNNKKYLMSIFERYEILSII